MTFDKKHVNRNIKPKITSFAHTFSRQFIHFERYLGETHSKMDKIIIPDNPFSFLQVHCNMPRAANGPKKQSISEAERGMMRSVCPGFRIRHRVPSSLHRVPIESHRVPLSPIESHRVLSSPIEPHRVPSSPIEPHRVPSSPHRVPSSPIVSHRVTNGVAPLSFLLSQSLPFSLSIL